jgi:hypothetical protein
MNTSTYRTSQRATMTTSGACSRPLALFSETVPEVGMLLAKILHCTFVQHILLEGNAQRHTSNHMTSVEDKDGNDVLLALETDLYLHALDLCVTDVDALDEADEVKQPKESQHRELDFPQEFPFCALHDEWFL